MAVNERRVAVLGAGTIGEALIAGLLSGGWREPGEIVATGRREERVNELRERLGVEATLSNANAVVDAALVVIAVKPQDFDVLLTEIAPVVSPEQTVLSVAAAIPTTAIEQGLPDGVPVVRAMPNAPATVHEGIAGMCPGAHADEPHLALAEEALQHLGSVVRVPEPYMDAVTAVSGSGPAYFALLSEAMIEAGILLGLGRDVSTQLVIQTMLGTAKLLRDEKMHPVERTRRIPERDSGGDGALARARGRRAVSRASSPLWRGSGGNQGVPPFRVRDRQVAANLCGRRGPAGETWFPPRDGAAAHAAAEEAAMERSRELAAGAP